MKRRGLGRGLGRGYYNLIPIDSYIHSLSAMGFKQKAVFKPRWDNLKVPKLTILKAEDFEKKFKNDYSAGEIGYATTKIYPDGSVKIYVKDEGDPQRMAKLIAHEFNELAIWQELVNEQGIDPNIADEMAHNLNEVKIEGVSDYYPIDENN